MVETVQQDVARRCPECGAPVTGDSRRIYCSVPCRKSRDNRAYSLLHREKKREYQRRYRQANTAKMDRLHDEPPARPPSVNDRLGGLLLQVAQNKSRLSISSPDQDRPGDHWGVCTVSHDEVVEHKFGPDLEEVLSDVLGLIESKTCVRCGEAKRPGQFAKDQSQRDGRLRYCRECESKRLKALHERRRSEERTSTSSAASAADRSKS